MKYTTAHRDERTYAWVLPANDIWSVPEGGYDFEYEPSGAYSTYPRMRGLVMDLDGRVFGVRALTELRPDGYVSRGRVSIGGEKYPAFTGKRMFHDPSGTIVDVAVLLVSNIVSDSAQDQSSATLPTT